MLWPVCKFPKQMKNFLKLLPYNFDYQLLQMKLEDKICIFFKQGAGKLLLQMRSNLLLTT